MKNNTSQSWKHPGNRQELLRSALLQAMGYTSADIEKPIIGILNTWGETNPGHLHFRNLAEAVKRGVWAAGGFPLEVNCLSICEVFFDVSSLIYRNLLAMETEELAARHPFDGIVLIGGCDKSVPAQLMAAATVNKPTIFLPGGAMLPGSSRRLGLSKLNMGGIGARMMRHIMEQKNIDSLEALRQQAIDNGVEFIACQMSMDVMGVSREELLDNVTLGGVATYMERAEAAGVNLFI